MRWGSVIRADRVADTLARTTGEVGADTLVIGKPSAQHVPFNQKHAVGLGPFGFAVLQFWRQSTRNRGLSCMDRTSAQCAAAR
jgi:hypothetical protein